MLRGEMRNCLSDLKPEFTAALHYGFLQEALGETRLGKGSPVSSSCACLAHKHVGGFLPGAAGAGGVGGTGQAASGALKPPPRPPQPVCMNSADGGRERRQISEQEGEEMATGLDLALFGRHQKARGTSFLCGPTSFLRVSCPRRWANTSMCWAPRASPGTQ